MIKKNHTHCFHFLVKKWKHFLRSSFHKLNLHIIKGRFLSLGWSKEEWVLVCSIRIIIVDSKIFLCTTIFLCINNNKWMNEWMNEWKTSTADWRILEVESRQRGIINATKWPRCVSEDSSYERKRKRTFENTFKDFPIYSLFLRYCELKKKKHQQSIINILIIII